MNRWTRRIALLLLVAVVGVGCRKEPEPIEGAPAEPVAAVQALAAALRDGDLERYARLSVPPAMFEQQKVLWRQKLAAGNPVDPAEEERWRAMMAELTAPDAEAALWAKAEPRLQDLKQQMGPQWAVGVNMMAGFAAAAVQSSPTLSEAEKAHAAGLIEAAKGWAGDQQTFTDPARAKAAIGVAVRTARALELPTLEDAGKLEFEAVLAKGGVAFTGAKDVAKAYGIDVDASLAQVQAEVVALDGPRATVRVSYPLLGQTVSFEQPMVQVDGGWYREDAIKAVEAELAALAAPADAAGATPAPAAPAP